MGLMISATPDMVRPPGPTQGQWSEGHICSVKTQAPHHICVHVLSSSYLYACHQLVLCLLSCSSQLLEGPSPSCPTDHFPFFCACMPEFSLFQWGVTCVPKVSLPQVQTLRPHFPCLQCVQQLLLPRLVPPDSLWVILVLLAKGLKHV